MKQYLIGGLLGSSLTIIFLFSFGSLDYTNANTRCVDKVVQIIKEKYPQTSIQEIIYMELNEVCNIYSNDAELVIKKLEGIKYSH